MKQAASDFSRVVETDRIGDKGHTLTIEATGDERRRLAKRLDLLDLPALSAEVVLTAGKIAGSVRLQVNLAADVVQSCVVTTEPVATRLADSFELVYVPVAGSSAPRDQREVEVDSLAADPPEPLIEGRIDVGEVVAEHLALAIDPYPRLPGAELPEAVDAAEDTPTQRPFEVLRRLKKN